MPAIIIDYCTYSVSITITCGSHPACFPTSCTLHYDLKVHLIKIVHYINFSYNLKVYLIKYWWHNHCDVLYGLSIPGPAFSIQKMLGMWAWGWLVMRLQQATIYCHLTSDRFFKEVSSAVTPWWPSASAISSTLLLPQDARITLWNVNNVIDIRVFPHLYDLQRLLTLVLWNHSYSTTIILWKIFFRTPKSCIGRALAWRVWLL